MFSFLPEYFFKRENLAELECLQIRRIYSKSIGKKRRSKLGSRTPMSPHWNARNKHLELTNYFNCLRQKMKTFGNSTISRLARIGGSIMQYFVHYFVGETKQYLKQNLKTN